MKIDKVDLCLIATIPILIAAGLIYGLYFAPNDGPNIQLSFDLSENPDGNLTINNATATTATVTPTPGWYDLTYNNTTVTWKKAQGPNID